MSAENFVAAAAEEQQQIKMTIWALTATATTFQRLETTPSNLHLKLRFKH
jgi:hypothetical protein